MSEHRIARPKGGPHPADMAACLLKCAAALELAAYRFRSIDNFDLSQNMSDQASEARKLYTKYIEIPR